MLGDAGEDVVDLISSPPPEIFPPVAVLGYGEDDDVVTCLITVATRHEALYVAAVGVSRGYSDVLGEQGLTAAGTSFARFATGTLFASDEVLDIVEVVHHAPFQRDHKRTFLLSRKSRVRLLCGNPALALNSLRSSSLKYVRQHASRDIQNLAHVLFHENESNTHWLFFVFR
jgi:hypothetical protein